MLKKQIVRRVGFLILLTAAVFLAGCNDVNRKQFTRLEKAKIENGYRTLTYQASTGASGLTCAPGSKNCKVDNSNRIVIWPVEDKNAEKLRMQWLRSSFDEKGYENMEYEIVSRQVLLADNTYDLSYDIKLIPNY